MGSFNLTCFASQHTISYKNKAFIIPISQQVTYNPVNINLGNLQFSQYGTANTSCYPDAFWKYAGPIIEGSYDDYGYFNLIENDTNQSNLIHFFNILHKTLFKVEQGENQYHDLPIDFQSLYTPNQSYSFSELTTIWHTLWQVGQKNRLFIVEKNTPRQLQFAVLHHKSYKFFENQCKDFSTLFNDFVNQKTSSLLSILQKNHSKLQESKTNNINELINDITNFCAVEISSMYGFHFCDFHYHTLYDNSLKIKQCILDFVSKHPQDNMLNKTSLNKIYKICLTSLKHRVIHSGLNSLNIKLAPSSYGGQDYSNENGKYFLEFIQSVNT